MNTSFNPVFVATVLENYLVDNAYLVMTYKDDSCEIYNRNYKFISDDKDVAYEIHKTKNLVQTWKNYPVREGKVGLGNWYKSNEEFGSKEFVEI